MLDITKDIQSRALGAVASSLGEYRATTTLLSDAEIKPLSPKYRFHRGCGRLRLTNQLLKAASPAAISKLACP